MTEYTEAQVQRNRTDWLAYLREPERLKACAVLADPFIPEARCCLGHYCDLRGLLPAETATGSLSFDGETESLPRNLAKSLDITPMGHFKTTVEVEDLFCVSASAVNDNTHLQPAQIADVLEQQFAADNFEPFPYTVETQGVRHD